MSHEVARLIAIFESERRFYDEMVTLLPVPLATVAADGAILSANQAFLREFSIRREELERKSLTVIFGNEDWVSALLPRDTGTLSARNFTVHFTPITRWERGETEWMVVFTPQPAPAPVPEPAPPVAGPDPELAANAAAIEAVQRLAGRVTHETNNLIMIASGYGREILNGLPADSPLREDVSMLLGATDRIEAMAGQLNDFSRNGRTELASYTLGDLLPADVYQLQPGLPLGTTVLVDRAPLAAVFAALPLIAPAPLTVEAAINDRGVTLTVGGFGMSAEVLRQHFEALNKAAREGKPGAAECALTGPRLAQAGVRWRVTDAAALELHLSRTNQAPARTAQSALVVDDQSGIRTIVRRILEARGFQVAEAGSGEEALSLLDRRREPFDLLVTDMRMPGMTGRDLADRVRFRHPSTRILFISGFTDDPSVQSGILPDRAMFLSKPFNPEQLVAAVTKLLE